MKISATRRFNSHQYLIEDREVTKLKQILSFYHSSWVQIPDFEKIKAWEKDSSKEVEIPVNELVF